jgi:hypothetical protein
VDREIGVALAVARLGIGQRAVLLPLRVRLAERQGAERLGQQRDGGAPHRHFARARAEHRAAHPDQVAQMQQLHHTVSLVAQRVRPAVQLHPARGVLQMRERRLPVAPERRDPPRHAHGQVPLRLERRDGIGGEVRALEAVGVGLYAARAERRERLAPRDLDT